nr:MAG TPA: hypothetical protein [Caudoviricetes sp.]
MSATADQTLEELRELLHTIDGIEERLGSAARSVVGDDLSSIYGDLENAIFKMECAFYLEAGE